MGTGWWTEAGCACEESCHIPVHVRSGIYQRSYEIQDILVLAGVHVQAGDRLMSNTVWRERIPTMTGSTTSLVIRPPQPCSHPHTHSLQTFIVLVNEWKKTLTKRSDRLRENKERTNGRRKEGRQNRKKESTWPQWTYHDTEMPGASLEEYKGWFLVTSSLLIYRAREITWVPCPSRRQTTECFWVHVVWRHHNVDTRQQGPWTPDPTWPHLTPPCPIGTTWPHLASPGWQ